MTYFGMKVTYFFTGIISLHTSTLVWPNSVPACLISPLLYSGTFSLFVPDSWGQNSNLTPTKCFRHLNMACWYHKGTEKLFFKPLLKQVIYSSLIWSLIKWNHINGDIFTRSKIWLKDRWFSLETQYQNRHSYSKI